MADLRFCLPALLLALAAPAQAADVLYPTGSRVGLVPPPGTAVSRNFSGFEDTNNGVAVAIAALPVEAYRDFESSMTAETLKKQGMTLEKREPLSLALGKGLLVIGRQEVEKLKLRKWIAAAPTRELTALVTFQVPDAAQASYPDSAIRASLASIAVRPAVPIEEQLSMLPFKLTELAKFRVGGVLAGRAVMLTDTVLDMLGQETEPNMVIAVAPGGPAQASDRETFARDLFGTVPTLKEGRIISSEPMRIGGQPGHQIMAQGTSAATGATVQTVQWLRFGNGAFLHMIGVTRTDAWPANYARFRQVRDGIDVR